MRFGLSLVAFISCALFGLLGSGPSASAYQQTKPVGNAFARCDVHAYVTDRDPNGLNVRSGPGKVFSVVGNLPFRDYTGVGVHITGSQGEWMRINLGVEEGAEEERVFFKGTGWVYGPLLGLTGIAIDNGATSLYRQPIKGRIVARVPGGDDVTVRGCRGEWLYVEYENVKGWAAPGTLCSNPLTTCG